MEQPPNSFEGGPEPSDEYEDLIRYNEDLNAQEALKEKVECGPYVEEFEEMLIPLLEEEFLAVLNTIETEKEAEDSEERKFAKEALVPITERMNFLRARTDIEEEKFEKLYKKYETISRAVGMKNKGLINHNI